MKFCPNCGASLTDGVKFCTECGEKLTVPAAPAAPVSEPPAAPVFEAPAAPVFETPAAPVFETPAEPAVETPAASVFESAELPVTPAPAAPAEPVAAQPTAPVRRPQAKARGGEPRKPQTPGTKKRMWMVFAGIGAAVILLVVLLVVLLGGKTQGEEADWGRYDAVSAETDGGAVSTDGEWIELQKNGKAVLCIMGSEYDAKWTVDGGKFTLTQSGDTYTGALQNGVLTVDLAGISYTFAQKGAGPVVYKAVTCISAGQILDEELMDNIGGCYVELNDDGTGKLYLFGDQAPITYDDKELRMGGEILPYTMKGKTMELNFPDGTSFVLEETDEVPEATDQDTEAWEESDVEAEFLTYLTWPGQPFSEMPLAGASLTVEGRWGEGSVWFTTDENGSSRVESMSLYVSEPDYDTVRDLLIEQYGEPTDEGEEPYAAANGGAVSYCWFEHPEGELRLSAGSEQDFSTITMTVQ